MRVPGAPGVPDSCEPLHGYWELIKGPLEDQPVILTSELSLQPIVLATESSLSRLSSQHPHIEGNKTKMLEVGMLLL